MPWTRDKALQKIRSTGLVPIVRTASAEHASRAAEAILAGEIGIAEITMTVPGAMRVIESVVAKYGDEVLLGAGTILDAETCRAAILAGAEFIVTPVIELRVVEMARRYSKPCILGALTPTEALAAWQAGADMVKIFPCGPAGGPKYLKAIRGPLPQIDLVPTGGVTLDTVPEYIKAGAAAVAVGGELVNLRAIEDGKLELITDTARKFLAAVRSGRGERASG
ncbi:MAG: bifunctional 4-hydroxy-2-oxoglutarate aldolase/2-dehydro-3-deoxy-phosphogluconate aldolase [Terriglobia bacterium]